MVRRMENEPKLGMMVTAVVDPAKVGQVTARCERAFGVQWAVLWPDLTERWHAKEELVAVEGAVKPMGFSG